MNRKLRALASRIPIVLYIFIVEYSQRFPLFIMQQNMWSTSSHMLNRLFRTPVIFLFEENGKINRMQAFSSGAH